ARGIRNFSISLGVTTPLITPVNIQASFVWLSFALVVTRGVHVPHVTAGHTFMLVFHHQRNMRIKVPEIPMKAIVLTISE
ncbi:MAG: hypothetical protein ACKVLM_22995, partial [Pseudomonadales bacterium]